MTSNIRILPPIHTSVETAFVQDDYPYGYNLRCKRRAWLEWKKHPKNAADGIWKVRFCTQTTNPRRAEEHWNAPKKSTYSEFAAAMWLDADNHLHWMGLSRYSDLEECVKFRDGFRDYLSPDVLQALEDWCLLKTAYEAGRE